MHEAARPEQGVARGASRETVSVIVQKALEVPGAAVVAWVCWLAILGHPAGEVRVPFRGDEAVGWRSIREIEVSIEGIEETSGHG